MNVLVTGGAGFIGSHVVHKIAGLTGIQVTVLDDFNDFYNPDYKRANVANFPGNVRVVEGDIQDGEKVEAVFADGGFGAVLHLAGRAGVRPSIANPGLYITTNVNGTYNVLEAARRHGIEQFIFASSSSVYGVNKKVPFSENDRIARTISPYAATKLAGEELCSNYAQHYGMRVVCLRFFTVYGPGQRPDLAISKFVRKIESDEPIERYGDGSTGRDYTYVDDIVDGVVAALDYRESSFEVINLGGSHPVTLSELIDIVQNATGKVAKVVRKPEQPGDVPFTSADVSKAARLLGYAPKVSIEEGVRRYVEWFRETVAAGGPSALIEDAPPPGSPDGSEQKRSEPAPTTS